MPSAADGRTDSHLAVPDTAPLDDVDMVTTHDHMVTDEEHADLGRTAQLLALSLAISRTPRPLIDAYFNV